MFLRIGKLSDILEVEQHVVRFWETKFPGISPLRRNGQRLYTESDLNRFTMIKRLLYFDGYTIEGAIRHIRENGWSFDSQEEIDPLISIRDDINNIDMQLKDILLNMKSILNE